jgi:predicted O-methyltransferase YrrM
VRDACTWGKSREFGVFMMKLARRMRPSAIVEMGTCLGFTTAYLAAGCRLAGAGRVVGIEGATPLAERAGQTCARVGLDAAEIVCGRFQDRLPAVLQSNKPVSLVFVDGHHSGEATVEYHRALQGFLARPSVVVFDDIFWSAGMRDAWQAICAQSQLHWALKTFKVGLVLRAWRTPSDEDAEGEPRMPRIARIKRKGERSSSLSA